MSEYMFYIFSFLLVLSAIGVISFNNPIYALLSLIFAFINTSCLFILMGAEFLSMILIIVYVGAIAVLFIFILMMLNVPEKYFSIKFSINFKKLGQLIYYVISFIGCFIFFILIPPLANIIQNNKFVPNKDSIIDKFSQSEWFIFSNDVSLLIKFIIIITSIGISRIFAQFCTKQKFTSIVNKNHNVLQILFVSIMLTLLLVFCSFKFFTIWNKQ